MNSGPVCHAENELIGTISFDGVASVVGPSLDNQGDPYGYKQAERNRQQGFKDFKTRSFARILYDHVPTFMQLPRAKVPADLEDSNVAIFPTHRV